MHSAQHLLSAHQHLDLLPGWHTLPTLGLLQSLADEWRIVIHLRLRTLALDPARKSESETGGYVLCACASAFRISRYLPANENIQKGERGNARDVNRDSKSVKCYAMIMDFASSFWFNWVLYFLWAGNARKSMRRGMTNVLTLALRDLKGSTSLNPSKKRKTAKKTCLTLGSARNRKRCFRCCEPEWPATSSQWSVQEW